MGNINACCDPAKDGEHLPPSNTAFSQEELLSAPDQDHSRSWFTRRVPDNPHYSLGHPHSSFAHIGGMSASNPLYTKQREGTKTSIGIALDGTEILGLTPLGAAARSGQLNVGDVITEVDGRSIDEDNILEALRGCDQVGSTLTIAVARPPYRTGASTLVTLVREPRA